VDTGLSHAVVVGTAGLLLWRLMAASARHVHDIMARNRVLRETLLADWQEARTRLDIMLQLIRTHSTVLTNANGGQS
jgi:hypothetical protein